MDNNEKKYYIAIDLKSFYASIECIERGFDAMNTNLVVADPTKTKKTICLAVTPSLKSIGVSGRARLFEVVDKVDSLNILKDKKYKKSSLYEVNTINERYIGDENKSSIFKNELDENENKLIDFIIAPPRMRLYMDYSSKIYSIYLKYISSDDIHVYSVDEVFIDATTYLKVYNMDIFEFARFLLKEVYNETHLTATCGIGTNLYLSKIAMDIVAKNKNADKYGTRLAFLDEDTYKKELWGYTPLSHFWRIGKNTEKRLSKIGLNCMGDIARCSLGLDSDYYNEDLLYKIFGKNVEVLIDHAWGIEEVTIKDIKQVKPKSKSISSGQVLERPYKFDEARLVYNEMVESLVFDLMDSNLLTDGIVLTINYDVENLDSSKKMVAYDGEIVTNYYGKVVPKPAHSTIRLVDFTNNIDDICRKSLELFDEIVDKNLTIRKINISAINIKKNEEIDNDQYKLFDNDSNNVKNVQKAVLNIKKRYGRNAIFKASSLKDEATYIKRNKQIGGHNA